jgi:hypothetical protein
LTTVKEDMSNANSGASLRRKKTGQGYRNVRGERRERKRD